MRELARNIWNHGLGQFFSLVAVSAIIAPSIAGYVLKWDIRGVGLFGISVYAIHSIVHFVFQVVCAEINNIIMRNKVKKRPPDWADIKVAVIVAGYREDPYMFERCLISVKDSDYKNIARIICIIDGNEEGDKYMAEIFAKVFNTRFKVVDFVLSEQEEGARDLSIYQNTTDENICIMQPHRGKREALYTASKVAMIDPTVQAIITTDSDTILNTDAVKELLYPLIDDNVGAVAGQVLVWNTDSLLTFVISFRYWLSFNLERACESVWKTVLCIAGPMGCYKTSIIKDVLDGWVNQKFLGNKCTYGDDRHLTNRILMKGMKVVYTPYAIGYTDTPYNYERYLVQQTRWSKSYFREFFFTIGCIHKHFIWMGYELVYHFTYFFLLIYWIIHLLYFSSMRTQAIAVVITTAMSLVRSIYGAIKTRDIKFLLYNLYSYVYYLMIIPAKIMALMTMWDISWGTRGEDRKSIWSVISMKAKTYFGVVLWVGVSGAGFAYSIYKSYIFKIEDEVYRTGFIIFMSYIGYIVLNMVLYYTLYFTKWSYTPYLNEIIEAKKKIPTVTIETTTA